jgi:hypothetical protein
VSDIPTNSEKARIQTLLHVDLSGIRNFCDPPHWIFPQRQAHTARYPIVRSGSDFTGWLDLPTRVADHDLPALLNCAAAIRSNFRRAGCHRYGGSYLGARAAIELLRSPQHNALRNDPTNFLRWQYTLAFCLAGDHGLLDGLDFRST